MLDQKTKDRIKKMDEKLNFLEKVLNNEEEKLEAIRNELYLLEQEVKQ